jgi:hypothetical protein
MIRERHVSRTAVMVLSYLSATWCGSVFLVLGSMLVVVSARGTYNAFAHDFPHNMGSVLGGLIATIGLGGVLAFVLGVAFGRFLLRAIPPNFSSHSSRKRPAIAALALSGALTVFVLLVAFFILLSIFEARPPAASETSIPTSDDDTRRAVQFGFYVISSALPAILWATGVAGPLLLRHRRSQAFLDRPFVLFLRRFSTFSDRAVIALVLREASSGVPVVFLTPTLSRPRDWDPYIVGLAGLKLSYPLRSVPIVLRAQDDDWQRAADELIRRAQTILVDTSETSGSLGTEAEMIAKAGRWSHTVRLRDAGRAAAPEPDGPGTFSKAHCIDYTKSWTRALPRLLAFFPITLFAAIVLGAAVNLLFNIGGGVLIGILLVLPLSFSILWRPAINRRAKIELSKVLRASVA